MLLNTNSSGLVVVVVVAQESRVMYNKLQFLCSLICFGRYNNYVLVGKLLDQFFFLLLCLLCIRSSSSSSSPSFSYAYFSTQFLTLFFPSISSQHTAAIVYIQHRHSWTVKNSIKVEFVFLFFHKNRHT